RRYAARVSDEDHDERPRIVFLCIGNACRSPMGEGWLRHLAGDRFQVSSGGIRPIGVQPRTVSVMEEAGVDMQGIRSSFIHAELDPPPATVIALSRQALASCPKLPPTTEVLRWFVPDPYTVRGGDEQILRAYRGARDEIRERLEDWLA
ncbi:MAG: arsenate reductase ArsC, partial [Planctomycetota bacterium]